MTDIDWTTGNIADSLSRHDRAEMVGRNEPLYFDALRKQAGEERVIVAVTQPFHERFECFRVLLNEEGLERVMGEPGMRIYLVDVGLLPKQIRDRVETQRWRESFHAR